MWMDMAASGIDGNLVGDRKVWKMLFFEPAPPVAG